MNSYKMQLFPKWKQLQKMEKNKATCKEFLQVQTEYLSDFDKLLLEMQ